jgi:predicted aspartyl protease
MKKLLLTGAAALALTTGAQAQTTHQWDAGQMGPVTQMTPETGSTLLSYCAVRLHDTPNAPIHVDIVKYHDGSVRFLFSTAAVASWTRGGDVTFDIDGQMWTLKMQPSKDAGALIIDADNETGPTLDLLHGLFNGQILTVTAGRERAVITLTGSATAIAVLNKCRDTIVAQRNSVATVAAAQTQPFTSPPAAPGGTIELKLFAHGGTPHVPVTFGGYTAYFTVDSGAADVTLPPKVFAQLILAGALDIHRDHVGVKTYVLADGSKQTQEVYRVPTLEIGGAIAHDVTINIGGDEDSGLLGESFLRSFSSWSIDNSRGVLRLIR